MLRVCMFASALFAAACASAAAAEPKSYKKEYQTANGKIAVTFQYPASFAVQEEKREGVALLSEDPKQLITFANGTATGPDGKVRSAKDGCEAVTAMFKAMFGDSIEFIEAGPVYKLDGDIETASVMLGVSLKDPDNDKTVKLRLWYQFAERNGQLYAMSGQWMVGDRPETQELTPQKRIEQAFGATFKSLKISDVR